ncbi:hypothetical protein C1893_06240 [Pseudomonas sp. MPR-ANC1]|uniref:hypothetical protein n=1 Tax=Pseudomonas sp. MPR-ANC1 TaxID=2075548 RepID=UPI000CD2FD8D|nr:hypothetical protein [Pseudomonas sp. MPR-ANC1]POA49222.1 hypothetical protein C1893_06240 [Pseudomonas sp. MPR-ANC1]
MKSSKTSNGTGTLEARSPEGLTIKAKQIQFTFTGSEYPWMLAGKDEHSGVTLAFPPALGDGAHIIDYPADLDHGPVVEFWSYQLPEQDTREPKFGRASIVIGTVNGLKSVNGTFEFLDADKALILNGNFNVQQMSK